MTAEKVIANTRTMLTDMITQSSLDVRFMCPAPVWDNSGQIYGVLLESDLTMGNQECTSQVSFTLNFTDDATEVEERLIAGLDAIFHRIQAKIVPKKVKQ